VAKAVLKCDIVLDEDPATLEDKLFTDQGKDPGMVFRRLATILNGYSVKGGRARVRVDSYTPSADTWTIACDESNTEAGHAVYISGTKNGKVRLLVAAEVDHDSGEFVSETSDTVLATNLKNVINAYHKLSGVITAESSTGTVTITAVESGNGPLAITTSDTDAFTISQTVVGADPLQEQEAVTVTVTDASIVDSTDALTLGNVTLTYVSSASTENQVTNGASDTASAANLAAAINAHSKLSGLISATSAAGVVTIVPVVGAERDLATLGLYSEVGDGMALSSNKDHAGTVTYALQRTSETIGDNVG
jgi:hypothetical protein